jgi:hypothetical protein
MLIPSFGTLPLSMSMDFSYRIEDQAIFSQFIIRDVVRSRRRQRGTRDLFRYQPILPNAAQTLNSADVLKNIENMFSEILI